MIRIFKPRKKISLIRDLLVSQNFILNRNLGLNEIEVNLLIQRLKLESYASFFPNRGGIKGFSTIIWWGSVITDIINTNEKDRKNNTLEVAGLFNLGIALFDTIIDDFSKTKRNQLSDLIESEISHKPGIAKHKEYYEIIDHEISLIRNILSFLQEYINENFGKSNNRHLFLNRLIRLMFINETSNLSDKRMAKQFPIIFIGALNNYYYDNTRIRLLYRYLGELVNYWDDWKDIRYDAFHNNSNYFLNQNSPLKIQRAFNKICYFLHLKNYDKAANQIIINQINKIISLARQIEEPICNNTISLLHYLFVDCPR